MTKKKKKDRTKTLDTELEHNITPGHGESLVLSSRGSDAGVSVPSSSSEHVLPRRDFLVTGSAILLGVSAVSSLAAGVRFASPDFSTGAPTKFSLGLASDFKMNTLCWLRDRDMFVVHDKIGFGAFSAKCTHLGCIVQRTSDGFQCPCHGARFGPNGQVLSGPARQDLPWFSLWVDKEGVIWVDCEARISAGTVALFDLKQQAPDLHES